MKVRELIEVYREQLKGEGLRKTTEEKYINSLHRFLTKRYSREAEIEEINSDDLLKDLKKIKMRGETSAIVNGLRRVKNYINIPDEQELKKTIKSKTVKLRENDEGKELKKIMKKINVLRDKKLKLGYRLMLMSGLRVFELAELNKKDIEITDAGIKIKILDGKGGKSATINCLRDKYLEKSLSEYLQSINEEKVFYSKKHMMNRALESGFECHDLRRAFSKLVYNEKKEEVGAYKANIEVQKVMRHTKLSTTKIYLNSKIKV